MEMLTQGGTTTLVCRQGVACRLVLKTYLVKHIYWDSDGCIRILCINVDICKVHACMLYNIQQTVISGGCSSFIGLGIIEQRSGFGSSPRPVLTPNPRTTVPANLWPLFLCFWTPSSWRCWSSRWATAPLRRPSARTRGSRCSPRCRPPTPTETGCWRPCRRLRPLRPSPRGSSR